MGWFRVSLSEDEQREVKDLRESHSEPYVRRRMWIVWLLHCGATRAQAARFVGVDRSTVERFVAEYRGGGLGALCQRPDRRFPASDLVAHRDEIRCSFEEQPVRTVAEACQRIYKLTGIRRGPTQVRTFMKALGMRCQRVHAIPVPPKKTWRNMWPHSPPSMTKS
jgi:transposase